MAIPSSIPLLVTVFAVLACLIGQGQSYALPDTVQDGSLNPASPALITDRGVAPAPEDSVVRDKRHLGIGVGVIGGGFGYGGGYGGYGGRYYYGGPRYYTSYYPAYEYYQPYYGGHYYW